MLIKEKMLKDGAVTNPKLALDSVNSNNIVVGAIYGNHLSTDAKQTVLQSKLFRAMTQRDNFSPANASSENWGTELHGSLQSGGLSGSDSVEGVLFTSPNNKCHFRDSTTEEQLEDVNGADVYGRLIKSALALAGTTDWANASTTVIGTGTSFTTELATEDLIVAPNGSVVRVASVTNDTNFELSTAYAGANASGQSATRNRITISYYILSGGSETAYIMPAAQTIDVQFPESFNVQSLPHGALTNNGSAWLDIGSAGADHNHDTRDFTETELDATTGTTGGDHIGIDNAAVVGMTGSNVQDGFEQIARKGRYEKLTIAAQNVLPNLTYTPRENVSVLLIVEGVPQRYGASYDYTYAGKVGTWSAANSGFNLDPGDEVWALYDSSD